MLQKILSFLFGRKSVDSILSSVNKNIDALHDFAYAESDRVDAERLEADRLWNSADQRAKQVQRARNVASKLIALVE